MVKLPFVQLTLLLPFSGNQEHSRSSELYKIKEIDVKYSIFVTFQRFVLVYAKQKKTFKKKFEF